MITHIHRPSRYMQTLVRAGQALLTCVVSWLSCGVSLLFGKPKNGGKDASVLYLEFPPFEKDGVGVLTSEEFWQELPANYHYECVAIPEIFGSLNELSSFVAQENARRRGDDLCYEEPLCA